MIRINGWQTLTAVVMAAGLLGGNPVAVPAGEPVTFSDRNGKSKVDLPSANVKGQEDLKPFDFLERKGSSTRGPVELPLTPSLAPGSLGGKRLREFEKYIDQKRNWIFTTTEDLKTTSTPKETFGVDDASLDPSKKSKKAIERYWDSLSRDSQSRSNRVSDDGLTTGGPEAMDDNVRAPSLGDGAWRDDPAKVSGQGANSLLDQLRAPDAAMRSLGDLSGNRLFSVDSTLLAKPGAAGGARFTPAQAQAHDEEFKRSILLPGANLPLSGINDPINSPLIQTRQAINPVTVGSALGSAPSQGPLDQLRNLNGPGPSSAPGGFDFLNTRAVGPSSLSPAVVSPVDSGPMSPKPTVLEIPRRRF